MSFKKVIPALIFVFASTTQAFGNSAFLTVQSGDVIHTNSKKVANDDQCLGLAYAAANSGSLIISSVACLHDDKSKPTTFYKCGTEEADGIGRSLLKKDRGCHQMPGPKLKLGPKLNKK